MDDLLRDLKAIKMPRGRKLDIIWGDEGKRIGLKRSSNSYRHVAQIYKDRFGCWLLRVIQKPTPAEWSWLMAAMHVACAHVEG